MDAATNKTTFMFGTLGISVPGVKGGINATYEPSATELQSYQVAVKELGLWLRSDAETFALVEHTYKRFTGLVAQLEHDFKQTPSPDARNAILALNAEFLGFMGMVRLYLDHTETKLKKSQPNAANELKVFATATSAEYDNVFAYRFCYKLRNFAQHCGFPITAVNAHSGYKEGTTQVEYTFSVAFARDYLLEKYDSWTKVKKDLENMPEQFPVLDITNDLMTSLRRINSTVLNSYLPRIEPLVKTIDEMLEHTKNMSGQPCLFEIRPPRQSGTGQKMDVGIQPVPIDILNMAKGIRSSAKK